MDTVVRRNFHTLDAMRGVAAVLVVFYHLSWGRFPGAYLAVDLFFVLSGFVLAHAYDRRFEAGLNWGEFFLQRLIRLWPLYLVGVAVSIGLQICLMPQSSTLRITGPLQIAMLPVFGPPSVPLYPLNVPAWTLLCELVVNVTWGLGWRFLRSWRLGLAICISAAALLLAIWCWGSVDVGPFWKNALGGAPRVTFSFFAGVGLHRWRPEMRPKNSLGISLGLLAIVAVCLLVRADGTVRTAYDATFVMAVSPALVLLGSYVEPPRALVSIFLGLGLLSYPIYAIHYPLMHVVSTIGDHFHVSQAVQHFVVFGGAVLLALGLARTYDPWARSILNATLTSGREAASNPG